MHINVDAILFDIDGTLVDSTATVERTWRRWSKTHRIDPEAVLAVSHGRRAQDTVAMFLPAEQVVAAVDELTDLELADVNGTRALPAAAELLTSLPADRWAAVTSGGRRLMRERLTSAGLPVPEVLVAAEDVSVGKPDPQGYRRAAAALGHAPERCLVIEDAPAGIRAGAAAGATVLAVATSHPRSELEDLGATAIVDDLTSCTLRTTPEGLEFSLR